MSNQAQHAEQFVLGALLIDNDAIDRIADLEAMHFYNFENKAIFEEITKQIISGKRADMITVFDILKDKIVDCLVYLNGLATSCGSSANIARHAELIIDCSIKRSLVALGNEIEEITRSHKQSAACVDIVASRVDLLSQRKTNIDPQKFDAMLGHYVQTMEDRISGKIRPISTGYLDLDNRLGGGFDRGTLTVIAGRPAMGKTALGLGIARNCSREGSALFLSMEMSKDQVCDRNVSALGKVPLAWLRMPRSDSPTDQRNWELVTGAFAAAQNMNLWIDDQTGLNMLSIRNKARLVKRKNGLDLLVIDQLSFITGASSDKAWESIGEYTRALIQIGKEMDVAVVLLAQLNRNCETRQNKRPMLSDLAQSGSIEQDADTILFLYRDEVYNPDTMDRGMAEIIIGKQRQGAPGMVPMVYIGEQTRFETYAGTWNPAPVKSYKEKRSGFD